jgi:hypothetical protein
LRRPKPKPVYTVGCFACDTDYPVNEREAHEATEHHKLMQDRLNRLDRHEHIEDAVKQATRLKQRGYGRCPRCAVEWLAPATYEGGPMVPVQLDACPRCGAKNPATVRADQKYQRELDAARERINKGQHHDSRRAAAAAAIDEHYPQLAQAEIDQLRGERERLRAELAATLDKIKALKKRRRKKQ